MSCFCPLLVRLRFAPNKDGTRIYRKFPTFTALRHAGSFFTDAITSCQPTKRPELVDAAERLDEQDGRIWVTVNSYHVDFHEEVNNVMAKLFRVYMPDNPPIHTLLGVAALGDPKMRVEVRVTAILPE